jgi:hypothetical protein
MPVEGMTIHQFPLAKRNSGTGPLELPVPEFRFGN